MMLKETARLHVGSFKIMKLITLQWMRGEAHG
jgi:hypothetical protein